MYREYRDLTVCGAVTQCCKLAVCDVDPFCWIIRMLHDDFN